MKGSYSKRRLESPSRPRTTESHVNDPRSIRSYCICPQHAKNWNSDGQRLRWSSGLHRALDGTTTGRRVGGPRQSLRLSAANDTGKRYLCTMVMHHIGQCAALCGGRAALRTSRALPVELFPSKLSASTRTKTYHPGPLTPSSRQAIDSPCKSWRGRCSTGSNLGVQCKQVKSVRMQCIECTGLNSARFVTRNNGG